MFIEIKKFNCFWSMQEFCLILVDFKKIQLLVLFNSKKLVYLKPLVLIYTDHYFQVLYLDYGNEEEVRYEDLYQLPESYSQIQMLSLPCSLYQFPELQG